MNYYIRAKYLRDDKPAGRSYTWAAAEDFKPGDIVKDKYGSKLMVADEPVDEDWLRAYGVDKLKKVERFVEPQENNESNK